MGHLWCYHLVTALSRTVAHWTQAWGHQRPHLVPSQPGLPATSQQPATVRKHVAVMAPACFIHEHCNLNFGSQNIPEHFFNHLEMEKSYRSWPWACVCWLLEDSHREVGWDLLSADEEGTVPSLGEGSRNLPWSLTLQLFVPCRTFSNWKGRAPGSGGWSATRLPRWPRPRPEPPCTCQQERSLPVLTHRHTSASSFLLPFYLLVITWVTEEQERRENAAWGPRVCFCTCLNLHWVCCGKRPETQRTIWKKSNLKQKAECFSELKVF